MIRKELRKWGGKSPVRKAAIIPASGKSPVRKAGELKFGRAVFQLEKAIIPASGILIFLLFSAIVVKVRLEKS